MGGAYRPRSCMMSGKTTPTQRTKRRGPATSAAPNTAVTATGCIRRYALSITGFSLQLMALRTAGTQSGPLGRNALKHPLLLGTGMPRCGHG